MKLKYIKSEIKAGNRLLENYKKVNNNYPVDQKNQDVFEIKQELERLQNLMDLKIAKKILKLKKQLEWS